MKSELFRRRLSTDDEEQEQEQFGEDEQEFEQELFILLWLLLELLIKFGLEEKVELRRLRIRGENWSKGAGDAMYKKARFTINRKIL